MNSSQKVVRSIRNSTLKLWADCAKQFVRNERNYRKSNDGFCTIITDQLTHQCLCVRFWTKASSLNQASSPPLPFSSSQNWKKRRQESVLLWLRRSNSNWNRSCWRFQKACVRSVSRIGENAGLGAFIRNYASTTVFLGFGPRCHFPLPKTEITDERKAFCYDWGDQRQIEIGAVGDSRKCVSRIGKNAGIGVLDLAPPVPFSSSLNWKDKLK